MTTAVTNTLLPTTAQAASNQANIDSGQKNLDSGYSTFLTLLTTQLKNQDPTSPLDTNAFTQQLVSMTGVQQQLLSNQLLQQLVSAAGGGQGVSGAVGMIGKTATALSSTAALKDGQANWTYNLGAPAAAGQLSISNSLGQTVWSGPASALTAGDHAFSWDGKDASGRQLADGSYALKLAATDASGGAVASTLSVQGKVTAVSQVNGQTLVSIGPSQVPLSQVTGVTAS